MRRIPARVVWIRHDAGEKNADRVSTTGGGISEGAEWASATCRCGPAEGRKTLPDLGMPGRALRDGESTSDGCPRPAAKSVPRGRQPRVRLKFTGTMP